MLGHLRADWVQVGPSQGASLPRPGAPPSGQVRHRAGQIRRIGDDQVKAGVADWLEQVAADRGQSDAVESCIEACCEHRATRHIDGNDLGAPRGGDRQDAASRAQIQNPAPPVQRLLRQVMDEQPGIAGRLEYAGESEEAHGARSIPVAEPGKPRRETGQRASLRPAQLTSDELRAPFEAKPRYTVGLEDEVMLLDPGTLALAPRAADVLALLEGDTRFKLELPASQLEIVTPPHTTVRTAAEALLEARQALVAASDGTVAFAAAGAHPVSPGVGPLNRGARYDSIVREYGPVAQRELVCALHVHVSLGDSGVAVAVHNAARSYLPLLAALAANAPFYEGRDSGLASVRPKLAELLPRQGVPPSIDSWEEYLEALRWGSAAGAFPNPGTWWWELRLNPRFGTLEFRVPDAQTTVGSAAAVAAVVQALVAWLAARHEAGEELGVDPRWKIEENRWSACRHGVEGAMADLRTGHRRATREALSGLLDELQPLAVLLGCGPELARARRLIEVNGAIEQRRVARAGEEPAMVRWLSERFLEPLGR